MNHNTPEKEPQTEVTKQKTLTKVIVDNEYKLKKVNIPKFMPIMNKQ